MNRRGRASAVVCGSRAGWAGVSLSDISLDTRLSMWLYGYMGITRIYAGNMEGRHMIRIRECIAAVMVIGLLAVPPLMAVEKRAYP